MSVTGHRLQSTHSIPNSILHAPDFLLGVGVVIIQPSTSKLVLVENKGRWFLPKGRKDKGETLEQAALREGYEESGYRFDFLPLYSGSVAPDPLSDCSHPRKDTEPIFITTYEIAPASGSHGRVHSGEYITFYYVGQILNDAVREEKTGMPNELSYVSHLLTIEEALQKLTQVGNDVQRHIVDIAWKTWKKTLVIDEKRVSKSVSS